MNDDAFMNNLLSEIAIQRENAMNQLATANARIKLLEQELAKAKASQSGDVQAKPE